MSSLWLCLGLGLKFLQPKLVTPPPSPLAKNGLHVRAVFASIVEATVFGNGRHQQGLVSERKQMNHDVPNEAYT